MSQLTESVLVVAFDGLDYELIQDFNCSTLMEMQEFGSIDNNTGIHERKTCELFASFITGETHRRHGIKEMKKWNKEWINQLEDKIQKRNKFLDKTNGLRKSIYESVNTLNAYRRRIEKQDLETPTIFEEIDNSKPLFVPSYNPSELFRAEAEFTPLQNGRTSEENYRFLKRHEFELRRQDLFQHVNTYYDFVMAHFHRWDWFHHLYDQTDQGFDKEVLEEEYLKADQFAQEILEYFEDSFDTIIFMSDHGLPSGNGHNRNAFYSCNQELFGEDQPHITDFHGKILELLKGENRCEKQRH